MRRGVERKLHTRRGASLLFAILFLLVATMVSTVIVSAATTAVKRVKDDTDRQQAYLSLMSAGWLIRDMLEESGYTITETFPTAVYTEIIGEDGEVETAEYKDPDTFPSSVNEKFHFGPDTEDRGPLGSLLREMVEELQTQEVGSTAKRTITIGKPERQDGEEVLGFEEVELELTVRKESVSAGGDETTFWIVNTEDSPAIPNKTYDKSVLTVIPPGGDRESRERLKLFLTGKFRVTVKETPLDPSDDITISGVDTQRTERKTRTTAAVWNEPYVQLFTRPAWDDEE